MHRWILMAAVLVATFGLAVPGFAQDENAKKEQDTPDMRAKVIENDKYGVVIQRPSGWVLGKANEGVVAVFRAAGDDEAQIEIRVSPHVKQKQRDFFFTSFHSNLQKAGFTKVGVRKDASYGDQKGVETEYETSSKKRKFRLIVWQHHHDDSAWMVVGFFPTGTRDKYYPDYQKVISELSFDE